MRLDYLLALAILATLCQKGVFLGTGKESIPSGTVENAKQFSRRNGATIIDGEQVSLTDKLVQRPGPSGTAYHLLSSTTGKALYMRREHDTGKDIIVFPDPSFPPGDGHFVVLKHLITNYRLTEPKGPIYEGFYLVLGDGLHAYMSAWKKDEHVYKPGEQMRKKKLEEDKKRLMHRTYNIEYSDVETSRMVKRIKRKDPTPQVDITDMIVENKMPV